MNQPPEWGLTNLPNEPEYGILDILHTVQRIEPWMDVFVSLYCFRFVGLGPQEPVA